MLAIGRELQGGGKIISLIPPISTTTHVVVEYPDERLEKLDAGTAQIYLLKTDLEKEFEAINSHVRAAIECIGAAKVLIEKRGANQDAWKPLDVEDCNLWRPLSELVNDTLYWMTSSHRCNPDYGP